MTMPNDLNKREWLDLGEAHRLLIDGTDRLVMALDLQGRLRWLNEAGARRLGVGCETLRGQALIGGLIRVEEAVARAERLSAELGQPVAADAGVFSARLQQGLPDHDRWVLHAPDGTPHALSLALGTLRNLAGEVTSLLAVQQADTELQLPALSLHDPLTGLPSRAMLFDRAEMAIQRCARTGGHVGLLVVDVDGFEALRTEHGDSIGDDVLRAIAGRLHFELRKTDTAVRIDRSRFIVLLIDLHAAEEAALVGGKIHRALAAPINTGVSMLGISASVGVATYPDHGDQLLTLMEAAGQAMLSAREGGGGVALVGD